MTSSGFDRSKAVSIKAQELEGGIYVAYFEFQKNGYYVRPIDEAWKMTVERTSREPKPLYSDSSENFSEAFGVDCWCDRKKSPSDNHALSSNERKGLYTWKTFVWIRPTEGQDAEITLLDWALRLKRKVEHFHKWTSKTPEDYGSWKYNPKFIVDINEDMSILSHQIVDEAIVVIMEAAYDGTNVLELMQDDDIIKNIFGPTAVGSRADLIARMTKAKDNIMS